MRRTRHWLLAVAWIACGAGVAAGADSRAPEAVRIERELERLGAPSALWPGFEPLTIPLAVFTGENTYLFRHPAPPAGCAPLDGEPGACVLAGRHPAVTSNTSADIGGTVSATLLADGPRAASSPGDLAAVALHEAFHVYQRRRHPGWSGNEVDLFVYPVEDAGLLALRRLESAALARALGAADRRGAACWARAALRFRRQRFAGMDAAFPRYERATELNEGLAAYLQARARGETTIPFPAAEFAPAAVRDRVYVVGPALAFLLDRLRPGWQSALESDDGQVLDRLLEAAAAAQGTEPARECEPPSEERAAIEGAARRDAEVLMAARAERRRAFDALPGWRVVVQAAEGHPLWPKGFDPLNFERVEGGSLHTRYLELANDAGTLRTIDEAGADLEALTEGVGPHPLFNGVRRVTIAGLAEPAIEREGGGVSVRAAGLELRFEAATARVDGGVVLVTLADRGHAGTPR